MDPYDVLGISQGLTFDQIKKRFYELAKKYHPDTAVDEHDRKEKQKYFAQITEAYNIIKNGLNSSTAANLKQKKEEFDKNRISNLIKTAKHYINNHDYNSAINILSKIKSTDDCMKDVEMLLGEAFLKKERFHEALKHFKASYDLNPWNVVSRLKIGQIYEHIGLKSSAKKVYEEILSIDPTNSTAQERLEGLNKTSFGFKDFLKKGKK